MKINKKLILIVLIIYNSCSYPEMIRDELIYSNDFENKNLDNIDGGTISSFNNTNVIGDFNNDGFIVNIENIGDHDYIFLSFDLYIHGSWDGNSNGFDFDDRADKWIIDFRPDMELYNDFSANTYITTFSNSPCWPDYCLKQSYPEKFPSNNNPKTGASIRSLERKCNNNFFGGRSSLYKIEKGFKSSGDTVKIRFYDELYQPNAIDKNGQTQEKCDESWSMDNLKIRAVNYR